MLSQLQYLAIAYYYSKQNPKLGMKILTERWSADRFPEEFISWWKQNSTWMTEQCHFFAERSIHFTYPGCWDYPAAFIRNIDTTPLYMSYVGYPHWNTTFNVAVVGSRKISILTKEWLNEELRAYLGKVPNGAIISGGARGVDQTAHLCAIRAKRPTSVFLPSGLDNIYPRDLAEWKDEILQSGGAFLSEYWPSETTHKHHFIARNRLIAAMSEIVLIAQGETKSGTMLTAKWALDLGRDIGVLPGHPKDKDFSGNLMLIRSGLPPIIDHLDLLGLGGLFS